MEPQFRTSFVPKKPVQAAAPRRQVRRMPLGMFFLAGLIMFLAAVSLSAGIFVYKQYLEGSITRKGEDLESARAVFEPALIRELTRLDARLETAATLLNQHVALTRLFEFLENNTLQNIQFKNFNYNALPDGNITLSMDGQADSFSSVALQSDVFGKSEFIQSPIFENLNADLNGGVVFTVTAFIDPSLISYRAAAANRPTASEAEGQLVQPPPSNPASDEPVPGTEEGNQENVDTP